MTNTWEIYDDHVETAVNTAFGMRLVLDVHIHAVQTAGVWYAAIEGREANGNVRDRAVIRCDSEQQAREAAATIKAQYDELDAELPLPESLRPPRAS